MLREIGVTNKTGCIQFCLITYHKPTYRPDNPYWEINNSLIVCDTDCQCWKKADLYKNILATLHLHGEVTWGSDAFDIQILHHYVSAFLNLKNVKHLVLSRCVQTQEQQVIISLTPPCCYHQFFQEHIIRLLQNILCYSVLNKHVPFAARSSDLWNSML